MFLREVGESLSTVTSLLLHIQDTGGSAVTTAELSKHVGSLLLACPALQSVTLKGSTSPALLRALGLACPLLSSLVMVTNDSDILHLQVMMLLLPSLVPNLTSLGFQGLRHSLPDISANNGILSLAFSHDPGAIIQSLHHPPHHFNFSSIVHWHCLPPKLQHLSVHDIDTGPPTRDRPLLSSLVRLELYSSFPYAHPLAQLLRAAPALQGVIVGSHPSFMRGMLPACIQFFLHEQTGVELETLQSRLQPPVYSNTSYHVECRDKDEEESLLPFIAALPCMTGVTGLQIFGCSLAELGPLLRVFPDLTQLALWSVEKLDDVGLQEVAAAVQLISLTVGACYDVRAMGVLALCQSLPNLKRVDLKSCQFEYGSVEKCAVLLKGRVSLVEEPDVDYPDYSG